MFCSSLKNAVGTDDVQVVEGDVITPEGEEEEGEEQMEWSPYGLLSKKEIIRLAWKNILVISISNMFVYISFLGLISLQSSLHLQEGNQSTMHIHF